MQVLNLVRVRPNSDRPTCAEQYKIDLYFGDSAMIVCEQDGSCSMTVISRSGGATDRGHYASLADAVAVLQAETVERLVTFALKSARFTQSQSA